MHGEYVRLKSQSGFAVTDHIYAKFSPIQSAYEELFVYGVLNNKVIKDKIAFAMQILSIPETHLQEHMHAIDKQGADHALKPNGKVKPEFSII